MNKEELEQEIANLKLVIEYYENKEMFKEVEELKLTLNIKETELMIWQ